MRALAIAALLAGAITAWQGRAPALGATADTATTRTYVRANYELVRYAASRLGTARSALHGVLGKARSACANAGANSPQNRESTQLSNEVVGALVVAAMRHARPRIDAFLQVAGGLRWRSAALTHSIRQYARRLRTISGLAPPDLCGDVKAWAASGFQDVPVSTSRFDGRFIPNWVTLGHLPALLSSTASADEKALMKRTRLLELRIADFEARAVYTWGAIMEAVVLYP
jgi:hypothetical protein